MIRKADINDFKDIYNLICILEDRMFDNKKMFDIYRRHIETDGVEYYVNIEDRMVVGMISLSIKETLHHNSRTGEIIELCVLPEYRNRGIGKALLDCVETIALKYNLVELELSSHIKRKDAHRFYERHLYNKDHFNFTKKINH